MLRPRKSLSTQGANREIRPEITRIRLPERDAAHNGGGVMTGQAGSTLTAAAEVAESALLGGRVRLRQPVKGYRAGMDAALLAAAVDAKPGERLIEAGCGAGAVLMQVAARRPGVFLTGLERDLTATGLARENAALNGVDDRTTIVSGDVAQGFRALNLAPSTGPSATRPSSTTPARCGRPAPARWAPGWPTTD